MKFMRILDINFKISEFDKDCLLKIRTYLRRTY